MLPLCCLSVQDDPHQPYDEAQSQQWGLSEGRIDCSRQLPDLEVFDTRIA